MQQYNTDWQRLYGIGQDYQGFQQSQLQDAINRWQFNQNSPWDQLSRLQSGLNIGSGYGTQTSPYYQNSALSGVGGALSGAAGGAMMGSAVPGIGTGLGAILGGLMGGGGGLMSHSSFKEGIKPITGKVALKMLGDLPIKSWRYKGDTRTHIGPMAEDFRKITGVGDGVTVRFQDELGLLMAAVKELAPSRGEKPRAH
jgi:hypothetical protein